MSSKSETAAQTSVENPYQSPQTPCETVTPPEVEFHLGDDPLLWLRRVGYFLFVAAALVFGMMVYTYSWFQGPFVAFMVNSGYQIVWCFMMVSMGFAFYFHEKQHLRMSLSITALVLSVIGLGFMLGKTIAGW